MKTYSFMGKQCAIHIPAENKKEAVKKLQEQGENANMKNVYLLHKGVYKSPIQPYRITVQAGAFPANKQQQQQLKIIRL